MSSSAAASAPAAIAVEEGGAGFRGGPAIGAESGGGGAQGGIDLLREGFVKFTGKGFPGAGVVALENGVHGEGKELLSGAESLRGFANPAEITLIDR